MKRIIEIVLMIALAGIGAAVLFLTGGSQHSYGIPGHHVTENRQSTAPGRNMGLDPAGPVDLAPFLPTPMCVVQKMLELAEVDEEDIIYDLGCGDGRIVITAAEMYGARGVGLDIYPQWVKKSQSNAKKAGVESLVEFRLEDATTADISDATVVTLYLLPESNDLLRPMLEEQLRPGGVVVTHNYHMPGWGDKVVRVETLNDEFGKEHTVFVYRL